RCEPAHSRPRPAASRRRLACPLPPRTGRLADRAGSGRRARLRAMSLSERRIWVNGRLVPWAEASVHVLSQSIQRGSLVFDVMPVYWVKRGPAILGLREHTERFERSMQLGGMTPPYDVRALIG